MNNKRNGLPITWGLVLIAVIITIMVCVLWLTRSTSDDIETYGTDTPNISETTDPDEYFVFSDGLNNPHQVSYGTLDDMGTRMSEQNVFFHDVNQDGTSDRIIRTNYENGTAHRWEQYNVQLMLDGKYVDITPPEFRTVIGTDCTLQKLQFVFSPNFQVIKISRPWVDSWATPSMASRTVYTIKNNKFVASQPKEMRVVCNVDELFFDE